MHTHVSVDGTAIEAEEDTVRCGGPGGSRVGTIEAYSVLIDSEWGRDAGNNNIMVSRDTRDCTQTNNTHGRNILEFAKLSIFISRRDAHSSTSCGSNGAVGFKVSRDRCGHGDDFCWILRRG